MKKNLGVFMIKLKVIFVTTLVPLLLQGLLASTVDFSFNGHAHPNGRFEVETQSSFPAHYNLEDIMTKIVLTPSLQRLFNEDITEFKSSKDMTKAVHRPGTHHFKVTTKARKYGVTGSVFSNCTLTVKTNFIQNKCVISDSKAGMFGKLVNSGSTTITCKGAKGQTRYCSTKMIGHTRGFYFVVFNQTESKLALLAIDNGLKTFFNAYYYARYSTVWGAANTLFHQNNLKNLQDEVLGYRNSSNKKLSRSVKFNSTYHGLEISHL